LSSNYSTDTNQEKQRRKELVSNGIDLILSLFIAASQQRLFPRTIMTKNLNGQIAVHSKEQILYWFEQADYQDCRINAYPAFLSKAEERDYDKGVNLNLFSPNILFIDLDTKRFYSNTSLHRALKQILKYIASLLYDEPLVLWSGHGYHIIIPVNAKEALENFTDFMEYTTQPSQEFLQFAEKFLSLNKADTANNPGFKSCLLRVPYTFNSECVDEGIDAEVKIVQQWDSSKPLPEIDNLLIEFQTFLVDKKLKAELMENKRKKFNTSRISTNNILPYAERLLQMSIPDYRKFAISLILAPYFINIQHLSDTETFCRINEWLLKCSKVKNLEPSVAYFDDYTRKAIERARSSGIKSLKFQETLKVKNKALYEMLRKTR
jgi:hypothetical protein